MSEFEARGIGGELQTGQLARETNWWGAFVIGLAGTVLVIGLIGYALVALGGFSIVLFGIIVTIGVFLCFCLAEMAATWPERAGGLPSYAFESFQPLGKRFADHVGGLSSWAYWLGWFTVAPINAYLAAVYFNDLQGLTNFTNSRSDDGGHTWQTSCASVNGAGVDRQWLAIDSNGGSSAPLGSCMPVISEDQSLIAIVGDKNFTLTAVAV